MTKRQKECLREYITLLRDFVAGKIDSAAFETSYLKKFKTEETELPEFAFLTLDQLFADVDAYCGDINLRPSTLDGIGDEELRTSAKRALSQLAQIV